jgi:hypothetical protein
MKTKYLTLKSIGMAFVVLAALWSCRDEFTEEDLINKQSSDSVRFVVLTYNASTSFSINGRQNSQAGLANLNVKINIDGKAVTKATADNGIAVFSNLKPGTVAGTISGTGFTTVNFVASIRKDASDMDDQITYASILVPVYETDGPNVATIEGTATCETNLLNNSKENVPDGTTVSFSISSTSVDLEDEDDVVALLGDVLKTLTGAASPKNATLESVEFETNFITTIAGGKYSIKLPTSPKGLSYDFAFSDFTANQSIGIHNYENETPGSTRDVVSIPTLFSQSSAATFSANEYTAIPPIHPVQIDITAPPAEGNGATATVKLVATSVAPGGFNVLSAGSGYTPNSTTIPVTVNGGDFDSTVPGATAASLTASSDANGRITGVTGTLGTGYRSQATLTIGGGGTGALVQVDYFSTVAPIGGTGAASGSTLTSGGSGYVVPPTVIFRGYDLNEYVQFTAGTVINNGAVINFGVTGFFSKAPTVAFEAELRTTAKAGDVTVVEGMITAVDIDEQGSAYNPLVAPGVVVRDLRGAGTGAQVVANMDESGIVDFFNVIARGSGYSLLSNANYPTAPEPFVFSTSNESGDVEKTETKIELRPGIKRILNVNFGTGIKAKGVE